MKRMSPACGTRSANLSGQHKHVFETGAAGESAFAGALNDGAVGERIAEGHAEFDHVRARIDGLKHDGARGIERGIAGGDIHHQARFVIEGNRLRSGQAP